jgi:hypothetical protein
VWLRMFVVIPSHSRQLRGQCQATKLNGVKKLGTNRKKWRPVCVVYNVCFLKMYIYVYVHVRTQNFSLGQGGGADPEAIYNICLILKIMLQNSCCKYNITLSATALIYTQI